MSASHGNGDSRGDHATCCRRNNMRSLDGLALIEEHRGRGFSGFRVRDSRVVDAAKRLYQGIRNGVDLAKRDVAIVKLTVVEALGHNLVHDGLDSTNRGLRQRADRTLYAVA